MWDEIREPLQEECFVPTNKGGKVIKMCEPIEADTEWIAKAYPYPGKPKKKEHVPREYPDGRQVLEIVEVPETNEEILAKWREDYQKVDDLRWLAFVEACIMKEDKPPGNTPGERVEYLKNLPLMVKAKLLATAKTLNEKRLAERYEEAKKD